jgi:hypothetical protein
MSGYYPPTNNVPLQYYNVNPHIVPNSNGAPLPRMIPETAYRPQGMLENPFQPGITGPFAPYAEHHMQADYGDMYEDVPAPPGSAQGANARVRRRTLPGEQVKHRRTRSGCFTCRTRRVKVSVQPLSDLIHG